MARGAEVGRKRRWNPWCRRLVEVGTALVLTMALFTPTDDARPKPTYAIVRLLHRRRDGDFDPRELAAPGVVLTMPVGGSPHGIASTDRVVHYPN